MDRRRRNGSGRRPPSRNDGRTGTGDTTPERDDENPTSQVAAKLRIEERELEAGSAEETLKCGCAPPRRTADAPELPSYLPIEERELEGGGVN